MASNVCKLLKTSGRCIGARKTGHCNRHARRPVQACSKNGPAANQNLSPGINGRYLTAAGLCTALNFCGAASALEVLSEPSNALSLPTWAIHVSSVVEWVTAMLLFWKYAEVTGNPRWKGMSWAMLPCLGSAMSACTWHFFYNSPELTFLVAFQAFLTVVGNFTCWWAAYRLRSAMSQAA